MAVMFFFIAIIGGVIFLYNAAMFERDVPKITIENNGYWNFKEPLNITIDDQSGVKAYTVTMVRNGETVPLLSEQLLAPQTSLSLSVEPPKRRYGKKSDEVTIHVQASDASKWNFFAGNSTEQSVSLAIDTKRPTLSTIAHSYAIRKGGSALVIFKADDENFDTLTIESNYGKTFLPQPFYKEGYYISLVAWPVMQNDFKATIVAKDKAGNISRSVVPYRLRDKAYRESKIKLSDNFLAGKIAELAEYYQETQGVTDPIEQFKIINEDVRAKNEQLIHDITSKVSDTTLESFSINPFYPLKNGQVVARFGDHRLYFYEGAQVSESYHLGLDLASVKMGAIRTQNSAEMVFAEENGIYGNMPVLHHGLGLYTIYGHCSSISVQAGESVSKKQQIGNTGLSGYAMGDHLHFGVLVQGIEVRPEEWMDKQWIRLNVTDVIQSAKKVIQRQ